MARTGYGFKTNNEEYYEAIEAGEPESAPTGGQPRFGLILIGALSLAISLGVALAVLH